MAKSQLISVGRHSAGFLEARPGPGTGRHGEILASFPQSDSQADLSTARAFVDEISAAELGEHPQPGGVGNAFSVTIGPKGAVIRNAILDLRRRGATVILSTHDMAVAESLCDSIFMIFRGKKVLDGPLETIQAEYGNDTIRVSAEAGAAAMDGLPNVEKVRDLGHVQELRMARGCDPQEVLRALLGRTRVTSFSIARPSLHDIFVRIAGPEVAETQHA